MQQKLPYIAWDRTAPFVMLSTENNTMVPETGNKELGYLLRHDIKVVNFPDY